MLTGQRLRRRQRSEHSSKRDGPTGGPSGLLDPPVNLIAYPPRPQANARLLVELLFDTWMSTVSPAATA